MNPQCPSCHANDSYQDSMLWVCPYCFHEWKLEEKITSVDSLEGQDNEVIKDGFGNPLKTGDTVTVIQDLKLKGSSMIKKGTKVKNIRILDPEERVNDHDISCKIEGIGSLYLKSSVVKKV